jgi:DNA-binding NtrC family response regulator
MSGHTILFLAKAESITSLFPHFREAAVNAGLAEDVKGALAYIRKHAPSVVFAKPAAPTYDPASLLADIQEEGLDVQVIVFTDRGSADDAKKYLGMGARDYWLEPLTWEKVQAVLPKQAPTTGEEAPGDQAAEKTDAKAHTADKSSPSKEFSIIGEHENVRRVLALAAQVAPSKASVLISGESGTGKEMFARYLHAKSDRVDAPFIAVNCAALPEHLLESELFGHEKGAFTGAIAKKPGKFELADGGTILLDEITEMDLGLQAKLLRVLQEGEVDRVGGTETVKIDVRVLATTNRGIEEFVEEKKFRQDLYFRLNVIPLKLPALKDRGKDVLLLADFFMGRFAKAYKLKKAGLSEAAKDWMLQYDWPGNVRELQNLMERAMLLAGGSQVDTPHFLIDGESWPPVLDDAGQDAKVPGESPEISPAVESAVSKSLESALDGAGLTLDEIERIAILKQLEQTSGNRTQAADLLGISVRTLRNKLNEYRKLGMDIP